MSYWVRFKFKIKREDIKRVLKDVVDFHRTDVRKAREEVIARVMEHRDELLDVPLGKGETHMRTKYPETSRILMYVTGATELFNCLKEFKDQVRKDPEDKHSVRAWSFSPFTFLETLEETQGLKFKLPDKESDGTDWFMCSFHKIGIAYDPYRSELKFALKTDPSKYSQVKGKALSKEGAEHEKTFVATAHNILTIVTKPVIDAGYKPMTEYQPFAGTRFLVCPSRQALERGGFVSMDDMRVRRVYKKRRQKKIKPPKSLRGP